MSSLIDPNFYYNLYLIIIKIDNITKSKSLSTIKQKKTIISTINNSQITMLVLLLLFSLVNISSAKVLTCGETYDECTKGLNDNVASAYTWLTGRLPCEDAFKLCVHMNKKTTPT